MAITPQAGYELDPNNPNRVRKIGETTTPDFGTISSASLSQTPTADFRTPPPTSPYPIDKNFITPPMQMSKEETDVQNLVNSIMSDRGQLADEASFTAEQNKAQGIAEKTMAQNDLYARIQGLVNQSLALQNEAQYTIPNAAQVSAEGRGITAGGLAPLTASQLRMNQIKQGAIASEALTLKSQYEAGQGNLENAKYLVEQAVKAKYDPAKIRIQTAIDNLDLLIKSPAYTLAEKNRAQRQLDIQNEKARQIAKQEADETAIRNFAVTAQINGAPPNVISEIQNAKSFDDAVRIAGTYLQDPKAKQELLNANLDYRLKLLQIEEQQKKNKIFDDYGGLSPEEWLEKQKEETKALDAKRAEAVTAKNNIDQIDLILGSPGLDAVVGPTAFARSAQRQGESFLGVGQVPATVFGVLTGYGRVAAELGGSADSVVALTEQLVSQKFLDKLIESKGQGATFGALTDSEGNSLRSAATAINQTAIYSGSGDNKKVIGYDMPESEFKRQMKIIKDALEYNFDQAGKSAVPASVSSLIDSLYPSTDNPLDYYP